MIRGLDASILARLECADLWRISKICVLLAPYALLKNHLSLPRLVQLYNARNAHKELDLLRYNWLINAVLRRSYGKDFCMQRSLIMFHLMRSAGNPVSIVFGVAKNSTGLKGHAWLEVAGEPYAESEKNLSNYKKTYCFPES